MNRIGALGLPAVVVLVISATSAPAAVAAPEFVHCVAKAGGTFGAGCTTAGSGFAKALVPVGSKIKFSGKATTSKLRAKDEITFTCTASTTKGEITGPTTVAAFGVEFTGCTAKEGSNASCSANSTGSGAGIIRTNVLMGVLGNGSIIKGGATFPAELLQPESKSSTILTKLEAVCLATKTTDVTKGVIGEIKPIGVFAEHSELIFACIGKELTIQELGFLNGAEETLKAFAAEACLEGKDEISFTEGIEVT
jgi:hypothetical protein